MFLKILSSFWSVRQMFHKFCGHCNVYSDLIKLNETIAYFLVIFLCYIYVLLEHDFLNFTYNSYFVFFYPLTYNTAVVYNKIILQVKFEPTLKSSFELLSNKHSCKYFYQADIYRTKIIICNKIITSILN